MALQIVWNNIVDEPAEALITPADRGNKIGDGADKAVHAAASADGELLEARNAKGTVSPANVIITPAFGLESRIGAKCVVHALGPCDGNGLSEQLILFGCYMRAFCAAREKNCKVISTAVLSSGRFGMDPELALRMAVEASETFLRAHKNLTIKIVIIDSDLFGYAQEEFPEYAVSRFSKDQELAYRRTHPKGRISLASNESDPYFSYVYNKRMKREVENRINGKTFAELFVDLWDEVRARERKAEAMDRDSADYEHCHYRVYLTTRKALSLMTKVNERYLKQICTLSRDIHPSKDIVIALCAAMKLPIHYVEALLVKSGHRFDDTGRDKLIKEYFVKQNRGLVSLSKMLRESGVAPLSVRRDGSKKASSLSAAE